MPDQTFVNFSKPWYTDNQLITNIIQILYHLQYRAYYLIYSMDQGRNLFLFRENLYGYDTQNVRFRTLLIALRQHNPILRPSCTS